VQVAVISEVSVITVAVIPEIHAVWTCIMCALEGKGRCKRSWVLRRSGGARGVAGMH
jgi:hypothetical protein